MIVKSAPGTQCPKELNPREYITDADPVEVPGSAYYLRLVDDGSLILLPPPLVGGVEGEGAEIKGGKK